MPYNPANQGTPAAWQGLDPSRAERLQRALDSGSSTGGALVQRFINKLVFDLSNRELGAWTMLDHREGSGDGAYVNRRTSGLTGGAWVTDSTAATEETGTPAQTTFNYRTALTRLQVSRILQARGRSYGDVVAGELGAKVPEFTEFLETALIQGDNAADANQPSGMVTLIQGTAAQIIANTTAAAGDSLVLRRLDEALDAVRPGRKVIFASRAGKRRLNAAMQAQQQFINSIEIKGGFRVMSYDDVPVVTSTKIPDVCTAAATTGKVLAYTGGSVTFMLVVNLDEGFWVDELTPVSVLPLARTTSQNEQIDVFADVVFPLGNTKAAAILSPILA